MCNLYNVTTSQEAIRQLTKAMRDVVGNLEPSVDVYPNMPGVVVRNAPASESKNDFIGIEHLSEAEVEGFRKQCQMAKERIAAINAGKASGKVTMLRGE